MRARDEEDEKRERRAVSRRPEPPAGGICIEVPGRLLEGLLEEFFILGAPPLRGNEDDPRGDRPGDLFNGGGLLPALLILLHGGLLLRAGLRLLLRLQDR
jgi:hypothetical protein